MNHIKESKYKLGDVVTLLFKPKELNPYVVVRVDRVPAWNEEHSHYNYILRNCRLWEGKIEASEWEMELHISEVRDQKLKKLGI